MAADADTARLKGLASTFAHMMIAALPTAEVAGNSESRIQVLKKLSLIRIIFSGKVCYSE